MNNNDMAYYLQVLNQTLEELQKLFPAVSKEEVHRRISYFIDTSEKESNGISEHNTPLYPPIDLENYLELLKGLLLNRLEGIGCPGEYAEEIENFLLAEQKFASKMQRKYERTVLNWKV